MFVSRTNILFARLFFLVLLGKGKDGWKLKKWSRACTRWKVEIPSTNTELDWAQAGKAAQINI